MYQNNMHGAWFCISNIDGRMTAIRCNFLSIIREALCFAVSLKGVYTTVPPLNDVIVGVTKRQ